MYASFMTLQYLPQNFCSSEYGVRSAFKYIFQHLIVPSCCFFLYQTLDGVINRLLNMNNWYEIFVILFTNMPPYIENDTR